MIEQVIGVGAVETHLQQRQRAMRENNAALYSNNFWGNLDSRRGQYALMRNQKIVAFFNEPYCAVEKAIDLYPDDYCYSIEKIEDSAVFMGMYVGLVASIKE